MARKKPEQTPGIFTADDYQELRSIRRLLSDLAPRIERAKLCGVNCDEFSRIAVELETYLSNIEQHFMSEHARGGM